MRRIIPVIFLSFFSFIFSGKMKEQKSLPKIPIIFRIEYDISFFGVENLHPFESKKYGKVFDYVTRTLNIKREQCYTPDRVTDDELLDIHTKAYLDSLNNSATIALIAEIPILQFLPNFLLRWCLLDPMRYATGGTLMGAELALEHGFAINLSGGYHHAKSDQGGGFCFYADIPLAISNLRKRKPNLSVMIIDLDAHQGNGHESICADDPNTYIYDVYNKNVYPHDEEAKKHITFDHPVRSGISDDEYLSLLESSLPDAIKKTKPDLIIYNAGTDVYEDDQLGRMNITKKGIIKRDELVFQIAENNSIPILMVLSGGYTKESPEIIGKSVVNILQNVVKVQ